MIRTIVFWDLYWGPPIYGNYHLALKTLVPGHAEITRPISDVRKPPDDINGSTGARHLKPAEASLKHLEGCKSEGPSTENRGCLKDPMTLQIVTKGTRP